MNVSKPSTATITIKDATTGQSVYTGTIGVNTGNQAFTWTAGAMTAASGRTAATR
ncbi:MAG: hypothetical protein ABW175_00470 [Bradyrhizobium sp.]